MVVKYNPETDLKTWCYSEKSNDILKLRFHITSLGIALVQYGPIFRLKLRKSRRSRGGKFWNFTQRVKPFFKHTKYSTINYLIAAKETSKGQRSILLMDLQRFLYDTSHVALSIYDLIIRGVDDQMKHQTCEKIIFSKYDEKLDPEM